MDARYFLQSLHDGEFSFVYVYKYNTYMDHGRQLLEAERLQRRLSEVQIRDYVSHTEFLLSNTGCVRCNSPKPLVKRRCMVCDHVFAANRLINLDKENKEEVLPVPNAPWYYKIPATLGKVVLEVLSG